MHRNVPRIKCLEITFPFSYEIFQTLQDWIQSESKGRFPWKPSPPWGHCWQQHFQRSHLNPHSPVSLQKVKLKPDLMSGFWLSDGKLLCVFLHLRAGGKYLNLRLLSPPNSIYGPTSQPWPSGSPVPGEGEATRVCWAFRELQTPPVGHHGQSWACLLLTTLKCPLDWSPTSLFCPFHSCLPSSNPHRDCPPCPEVMSLSSLCPPKSASPLL